MAKIKITMTADVDDLPAYVAEEPISLTKQNIFDFINKSILCNTLEGKLDALAQSPNDASKKALIEHINQDIKLAKRLMASLSIKVVKGPRRLQRRNKEKQ